MKCAVLYARTNDQDELRLAEELQMCRQYAQRAGWHIVAELSDLEVSGLASMSLHLVQAVEMAHAGKFDVLVVRKMDHLSRDLAQLLAHEKEFEQAGVMIECLWDECNDRDPGEKKTVTEIRSLVYARASEHHQGQAGREVAKHRQKLWEDAFRNMR